MKEANSTKNENAGTPVPLEQRVMPINYLQHHGTSIHDKERQEILSSAQFDGFEILKHDLLCDGSFDTEKFSSSWCFVSHGVLYHYLTNFAGQISSFFKLNTRPDKCTNGKHGVYYEVVRA